MKIIKSIFSILMVLMIIVEVSLPVVTDAAIIYIQPRPAALDVATSEDGEYNIGYDNIEDKHKVRLLWKQVEASDDVKTEDSVQNGDIAENGYKLYTSTDNVNFNLYPANIGWGNGDGEDVSFTVDGDGNNPLKSGTVYYTYVTAYHKHGKMVSGKNTETVHESLPSNAIIFMTEIDVSVTPTGTDSIMVTWDDVKFNGSRLDYDIEMSQSKDFVQPRVYNVRQQNIGAAGPVIPVKGTLGKNDKLTIGISGSDYGINPGTVYYVRIKPKNVPEKVRYKTITQIAVGYTNIIASMTRLSDEWWRIDWNAITESSLGEGQQVMYKVKRGRKSDTNPILVTIAETSDRRYPVNVTGDNYFFIVVAEVKDQYGNYIPDGIQSGRLLAVETEVAVQPAVPEIQDEIRTFYPNGEIIYTINDSENLNAESAAIAWLPPKFADGSIDSSVVYDVWLFTDAAEIDNTYAVKLKENYKIGADASSGYITISNNITAYKMNFALLTPNTTYYLKIVAKKLFTVNNGGDLSSRYYESQPALKVIITPSKGKISQPLAPAKPPFKIKQDSDNKYIIGTNDVTVEWKNNWYEKWDGTSWISVTQEVYDANAGSNLYRHNIYDDGVSFRIGYFEYQDGMNYENIKTLPTQISGISSSITEWNVQNLISNTTYVMWLRAYRNSMELLSEPSDPIIVVTKPDNGEQVVKPTTPYFIYNKPGDTYVDLQWSNNSSGGYTYYIKYSTSDNINGTTTGSVTVTPHDLKTSSIYRINDLKVSTVYYFWIQADSTGNKEETGLSQWSDSYVVKTEKYAPPEIPIGFGVKNSEDAMTKNSITFEWLIVDGLEYRLEIDINPDFSSVTSYKVGSINEYKVEELRSNYRYYARLYAYDPQKELESSPTAIVTVRTLKSNDEYDYDEDIDINYSEPSVTNAVYNRVWTFMINKVNSDRLIEIMKNDAYTDYIVDMTQMPSGSDKRALIAPGSFFEKLSSIRENMILNIGTGLIVIRPYVLNKNQFKDSIGNLNDFTYNMEITTEAKNGKNADNYFVYKTDSINIAIKAVKETEERKVNTLDGKLKLSFKFEKLESIEDEKSQGYYYNPETKAWTIMDSTKNYDNDMDIGYITLVSQILGTYAILEKKNSSDTYADMGNSIAKEPLNVLSTKYNLNSLKENLFKPNQNMTVEAAVKIVLDVLGYTYRNDYIKVAYKAGLINENVMSDPTKNIKKKDFLNMLNRLYEIKTGVNSEKAQFKASDDVTLTRENAIVELYNKLSAMGEF